MSDEIAINKSLYTERISAIGDKIKLLEARYNEFDDASIEKTSLKSFENMVESINGLKNVVKDYIDFAYEDLDKLKKIFIDFSIMDNSISSAIGIGNYKKIDKGE